MILNQLKEAKESGNTALYNSLLCSQEYADYLDSLQEVDINENLNAIDSDSDNGIDNPLDSSSPFYHTIVITAGSCIKKAAKGEMTSKEYYAIIFELEKIISKMKRIDITEAIAKKERRIYKHSIPLSEKI